MHQHHPNQQGYMGPAMATKINPQQVPSNSAYMGPAMQASAPSYGMGHMAPYLVVTGGLILAAYFFGRHQGKKSSVRRIVV